MSADSDARRALWLLSVAVILAMATWFSATAVLPQLRAEWDLSSGEGAWLTIAVQIGFVVGAVASAFANLADVIRPRRLILLGSLAAAAANAGLVATDGFAAAVPLRFATGAALALVYPSTLKVMATWFQRGRGTALGILVGALTIGSAIPHLVNGLGGLEWQAVVLATSGLTVIGGLLAARIGEGPYPFPPGVFDPGQVRRTVANRGVRLASFGYFGHMWELFAMWAWFLIFFSASLEAGGSGSENAAALATFAVIAVGGLGCWAGGVLGDRWGRTTTTSVAMAISAACAATIGLLFTEPSWVVLAVGLIWGFAVVADSAQFSTMVTELADQAYVGTALTLQLALGFTLTVATIWLIPVVQDEVGWRWAFALLAPGPLLGIAAMLRLRSLPEAASIAGGRG